MRYELLKPIESYVVRAKKEFAQQMAVASRTTYGIFKGGDAVEGGDGEVLGEVLQYVQVGVVGDNAKITGGIHFGEKK